MTCIQKYFNFTIQSFRQVLTGTIRGRIWSKYYCIEEEDNGKMFKQTGDISPSKFIHNSPAQRTRKDTLISSPA